MAAAAPLGPKTGRCCLHPHDRPASGPDDRQREEKVRYFAGQPQTSCLVTASTAPWKDRRVCGRRRKLSIFLPSG